MVAGLKNIKIVQDIPVADVAVRADIDMVKTVIRNLISNAIKFSNEGRKWWYRWLRKTVWQSLV